MPTYIMKDGELVLKTPENSSSDAPYVISDEMSPTKHMATGEVMTSKSEFRKVTKATGNIEYGNEELIKPRKQVPLDRRQRREDIRRAIHDLRDGRAPSIRHILEMNKE